MRREILTGEALRRQVEELFQVVPERATGDELVFICPEPGCGDESGNRSVNLTKGVTNCWRCNKGGNFTHWATGLGYDLNLSEARTTPVNIVESVNQALTGRRHSQSNGFSITKLPEGFTRLQDDVSSRPGERTAWYRLIDQMAEQKHLAVEDFMEAGVGYTRTGLWEPYAIFPVNDYGRLVYFQGRACDVGYSTRIPAKRFPSGTEVSQGAGHWVYNIDQLRESHVRVAIVVESILNVLSLRKKLRSLGILDAVPVCVFKRRISRIQAQKIAKCHHVKEVCIFFDHDATEYAREQAKELSTGLFRKFIVSIAEMPEVGGNPTSDPNDDVNVAWQSLQQREIYRDDFAGRLSKLFAPNAQPTSEKEHHEDDSSSDHAPSL
jgi:hypothetical protein